VPNPQYEAHLDVASGIRFVFKKDEDDSRLLHIYARHLTTVDEAIETYFLGSTTYNEKRKRFETMSSTHGVFWFWLKTGTEVMVISCFRIEEATWTSG
jgi:hypothetical protein